jgi:hypothetical protein
MLGRAARSLGIVLVVAAIAGCLTAPAPAQRAPAPAAQPERDVDRYQAARLQKPEPIAATSGPASPHTGLDARVGSLPFTGWDLIILGGVTLVLGGTGVLLRRLSVPR